VAVSEIMVSRQTRGRQPGEAIECVFLSVLDVLEID